MKFNELVNYLSEAKLNEAKESEVEFPEDVLETFKKLGLAVRGDGIAWKSFSAKGKVARTLAITPKDSGECDVAIYDNKISPDDVLEISEDVKYKDLVANLPKLFEVIEKVIVADGEFAAVWAKL
jgi:hypothetical protein